MNRPGGQREAAAETAVAVGAMFLAGAGGSRFPPLEILGGAIGLCLFVALLPPIPTPTTRARAGRMVIWVTTLAAVLWGARAIDPASRLLLPALAWSIAAIPIGRRDAARARLQSGAATLILIAAFLLALDHSMLLRTAWSRLSIAVTTMVSMLAPITGSDLRAGPAASGLNALVPFLAATWVIGGGRRSYRPLVFLVTTWIIGLAAVGWWMRFGTQEWFHLAVGHRHGSTDPALAWFRSAIPIFPLLFAGSRLALNDVQDTELLLGTVVDSNEGSLFIFAEAGRRFGQAWVVELEGRFFTNVDTDGPAFAFSRDDFVNVSVQRHF